MATKTAQAASLAKVVRATKATRAAKVARANGRIAVAIADLGSAINASAAAMVAVAVATALVLGALLLPFVLDAVWQARTGGFQLQAMTVGRISPLAALVLAGDLSQRSAAAAYWWSLAAQMGLAGLLVADAARCLQAMWRRDEAALRAPRKIRRRGKPGNDFSTLIAQTLAARVHLGRWLVALVVLSLVAHIGTFYQLVFPPSGPGGGVGGMLVTLPAGLAWLARRLLFVQLAARIFADARQSGEMEILLTTRLDNAELVRLLWLALRRAVLGLAGLDLLFGLVDCGAAFHRLPAAAPVWVGWNNLLVTILQSFSGAFAWVALTWSAMWFGISSRSTAVAVAKSFGLDLAIIVAAYVVGGVATLVLQLATGAFYPGGSGLPVLLSFLPILMGFLPILSLQVGLNWWRWRWARTNLTTRFRLAAAGSEIPGIGRKWYQIS